MTDDELMGLILPWAKEFRPEAYAETVKQYGRKSMRKFLIRLVELRAESDKTWRNALPLAILQETCVTVTLRRRSNQREIRVAGVRAKPLPKDWSFEKLGAAMRMGSERFDVLDDLFDVEVVSA